MTRRLVAVCVAAFALAAACSDESPAPVTLIPTTRATVVEPDAGSGEGDSGATTPDEQLGACSDLSRAYYAAIGSSGPEAVVRPLYEAVTPLLTEALRGDWALASEAFIAYEDAASAVAPGDDQLDDPDVRDTYDVATSDDVQDALARVRAGIDSTCPGTIDDLTTTTAITTVTASPPTT